MTGAYVNVKVGVGGVLWVERRSFTAETGNVECDASEKRYSRRSRVYRIAASTRGR